MEDDHWNSFSLEDWLQNTELFTQESEPKIVIIEQPKQRGYRFRYASEGGSHGAVPGESSTRKKKSYPAVHIDGYSGPCRILVSLVTATDPPVVHAHNLTGENTDKGYAVYSVAAEENMAVSFNKLAIEHVTNVKTLTTLMEKLEQEDHIDKLRGGNIAETPDLESVMNSLPSGSWLDDNQLLKAILEEDQKVYRKRAEELRKNMNFGAVRLRFDAFLPGNNTTRYTRHIGTEFSHVIYDQKAFGELKIVRLSSTSGSVMGNEDVIMLCEKVNKDSIQIRFFHEGKHEGSWESFASFSPPDVHKQVAICFKTPPYKDKGISRPVEVFIELRRKDAENDCSSPVKYTYKPEKSDRYKVGEKRRKEIPPEIDDFLNQRVTAPTESAATADAEMSDAQLYRFSPELSME